MPSPPPSAKDYIAAVGSLAYAVATIAAKAHEPVEKATSWSFLPLAVACIVALIANGHLVWLTYQHARENQERRWRSAAQGELAALLAGIFLLMKFEVRHDLRATIFYPDWETYALRQLVRRTQGGASPLSDAVVRMGTGTSGKAFTERDYVSLQLKDGQGFLDGLESLNIERSEAIRHRGRDRKSFVAICLVHKPTGEPKRRVGVVALDSLVRKAFVQRVNGHWVPRPELGRLLSSVRGNKAVALLARGVHNVLGDAALPPSG